VQIALGLRVPILAALAWITFGAPGAPLELQTDGDRLVADALFPRSYP
jgi:hypothetical protein